MTLHAGLLLCKVSAPLTVFELRLLKLNTTTTTTTTRRRWRIEWTFDYISVVTYAFNHNVHIDSGLVILETENGIDGAGHAPSLYTKYYRALWYRDGAGPAPSTKILIHIFHHHRVAMSEIHVCLYFDKICMGDIWNIMPITWLFLTMRLGTLVRNATLMSKPHLQVCKQQQTASGVYTFLPITCLH